MSGKFDWIQEKSICDTVLSEYDHIRDAMSADNVNSARLPLLTKYDMPRAARMLGIDVVKDKKTGKPRIEFDNDQQIAVLFDFAMMFEAEKGRALRYAFVEKYAQSADEALRTNVNFLSDYTYAWLRPLDLKTDFGFLCEDLLTKREVFLVDRSFSQRIEHFKGVGLFTGIHHFGDPNLGCVMTGGAALPVSMDGIERALEELLAALHIDKHPPLEFDEKEMSCFVAASINQALRSGASEFIRYGNSRQVNQAGNAKMAESQILEPVTLDDSKPSQEQLREAYELAFRLWELQPWDMPIGENQLLAVERADGRKYVLSVLGEHGEHRALLVYPNVASYYRVMDISIEDELLMRDAFFSIRQMQFSFLKASQLLKNERAAIKASGVKFPRGVNPSFQSFVPGYDGAAMGAHELAEAVDALKVFLDFMTRYSAEDIAICYEPGDPVSTWREAPDGSWTLREEEFPGFLPMIVNLPEALLDKVAALPLKQDFHLEIGAIPIPCGMTESGRRKMPRYVIVANATKQVAMAVNIIEPPEGREFDWTPVAEFALNAMVQSGYRPGRLGVLGESLRDVMGGLCQTVLKGTKFLPYSKCDTIRDLFEFTVQRMGF